MHAVLHRRDAPRPGFLKSWVEPRDDVTATVLCSVSAIVISLSGDNTPVLVGMSSGNSTPTYRSVHYATLPPEDGYSRPVNGRSNSSSASYRIQYRLYRWRWFMLAALCALNVSNGMVSTSVRLQLAGE